MLNKMRLLTPGPTPLPEEVRLALARDMIHHRKADFSQLMARAQTGLKTLFGTRSPVLPLACSGTGAMTAAVYSLFAPGQTVLVVETGKFGQRWGEIAASRGLAVEKLQVEWGRAVRPEQVRLALERNSGIAGVLMQLSETSTGVLNPVQEIAALMEGSSALLVVDGISAVGISPCPMDEWKIDCLLTGSQKGLMLPPGLALLALSERAWEIADRTPPGCFYFNLPAERKNLEKNQTCFTTPVNLIAGLEASLQLLLKNGLQDIYRKQWALTMLTRAGIHWMGLQLFARDSFAWGVTSILLPSSIDGQEILKLCQKEFGIVMAGGQDHLKGRIIRIGHMGWVDWGDCVAALCALSWALERHGVRTGDAFLNHALKAYRDALENPKIQGGADS